MSFKKIQPEVLDALSLLEITTLEKTGKTVFSQAKSGGNLLVISPEHSGKTTGALVTVFNKVNQEYEGSPRAIVVCSTIDKAVDLHTKMVRVGRRLDVTVDLAHDKGNMLQQRNDIFDGTEIVVGTPKRIYELYLQNGINLNLLELFIVDDLDEVLVAGRHMEIKRLIESLNKAQIIFLANSFNKKTEPFLDSLELPFRVLEEE